MLHDLLRRPRRFPAIAAATALLLVSCGTSSDLKTVTAAPERIELDMDAPGIVVPSMQARINFKISGTLIGYKVPAGTHVTEGQEIATIAAPDRDLAAAKAQYDLVTAQTTLASAQAKLDRIQGGPLPEDVQQAQGSLASAQAKLTAAQAAGRPEDVASKQSALDAAKEKLAQMQGPPRPIDLDQAKARLDAAQRKLEALKRGPRPEDIQISQTAVEQAKDTLLSSQITRDAVCASSGATCDAAQASVNAAQSGVDLARQQLALKVAPPTAQDLSSAEADVSTAQQSLDHVIHPFTDQEIQQQREAVTQAQQALAVAQHPSSDQDVAQARAALLPLQAALAKAQKPYTQYDLADAQASVDQATAQLKYAQAGLDNAKLNQGYKSLTAPFDGVILAENAQPGESVDPSGVLSAATQTSTGDAVGTEGNSAILMAADKGVTINATIDQNDIAQVSIGQDATITFDAMPGRVYKGKVVAVPQQGARVQNVPQYVVRIALDDNPGLEPPKPGMTATCTLQYVKQSALAVATSAIRQEADKSLVTLLQTDGTKRIAAIQTGISNGQVTEIVSGLKQGDKVVLPSS